MRNLSRGPPLPLLACALVEQDDQQSSQSRRAERYRQETKALFKKYGASLMMNAALPLVQLPLFIGFFLGLRRMPEANPEFATGGTLWFQVKLRPQVVRGRFLTVCWDVTTSCTHA